MLAYKKIRHIILNSQLKDEIIGHCYRKLSGAYLKDETHEPQAYGLMAGEIYSDKIIIKKTYPCKNNFRNDHSVRSHINNLVENYAIKSTTPISQRGWIVQPTELLDAYTQFEDSKLELIGSYHMHHDESWLGDFPKDLASEFDAKLAEGSNMFNFIVAIKSGLEPSIRAFFESRNQQELEIIHHEL